MDRAFVFSTIVTPIYGKLSDIFGRRPLFLIAIVLFLIGSIACSFSQDMVQLALFRALQRHHSRIEFRYAVPR